MFSGTNLESGKDIETVRLRVISLLLAIVLTVLLIPTPASAAETKASAIQAQIRDTYRTALRRTGRHSFNGYCGTMVNWQTYLLGIDQRVYGCDGKNEYDLYRDMGTTTGGYRVECYPASQYTLRAALNTITDNGTRDAYNILVGFQRTNTRDGSIYGHALLIHGILDGVVYFAECYSASIGGQYWAEGTPIAVSIDTFCDYYDRWTVFDGIACFGLKTYADLCTEYAADMYAMAGEKLPVYGEPYDEDVSEPELTGTFLTAGQVVKVTGLLVTPKGANWYRVEETGGVGYVQAEKLDHMANCWEDLLLTELKVPASLRKGAGFALRGSLTARNCRIQRVLVSVYDTEAETPVLTGGLEPNSKSVSLSDGRLDRAMTFRKLDAGVYRLEILADVESYVLEDGEPVARLQTLTVWNSLLQIVTGWDSYAVVTFDAGEGKAELDQTVIAAGQAIGSLPSAARSGWELTGWALDPEGTKPVTAETVIDGNTTLYAQWRKGAVTGSGWINTGNGWQYYSDGAPVSGWVECAGLQFYQLENGAFATGWLTVGNAGYYFDSAGIHRTGWQEINGERCYVCTAREQSAALLMLGGGNSYFDSDGWEKRKPSEASENRIYLPEWFCWDAGVYMCGTVRCLFADETAGAQDSGFLPVKVCSFFDRLVQQI